MYVSVTKKNKWTTNILHCHISYVFLKKGFPTLYINYRQTPILSYIFVGKMVSAQGDIVFQKSRLNQLI